MDENNVEYHSDILFHCFKVSSQLQVTVVLCTGYVAGSLFGGGKLYTIRGT